MACVTRHKRIHALVHVLEFSTQLQIQVVKTGQLEVADSRSIFQLKALTHKILVWFTCKWYTVLFDNMVLVVQPELCKEIRELNCPKYFEKWLPKCSKFLIQCWTCSTYILLIECFDCIWLVMVPSNRSCQNCIQYLLEYWLWDFGLKSLQADEILQSQKKSRTEETS